MFQIIILSTLVKNMQYKIWFFEVISVTLLILNKNFNTIVYQLHVSYQVHKLKMIQGLQLNSFKDLSALW